MSNKLARVNKIKSLNKSDEFGRHHENIFSSNANKTNSKVGLLLNSSKRKKRSKVQQLSNAPYLNIAGSSSMIDENFTSSSSRKGIKSDSKRNMYFLSLNGNNSMIK